MKGRVIRQKLWAVVGLLLIGVGAASSQEANTDEYLSWTADLSENAIKSMHEDGRVGGFFDTRILSTNRSYNYKLSATWLTPEVIRARARVMQLSGFLSDTATRELVTEAEAVGDTVVLVEIDPRGGSGVIPLEWGAFLRPKGDDADESTVVPGVSMPTLRRVSALAGLLPRNYDYDRHCQVDVEQAGSAPDEATTRSSASDTGHLTPDTEGPCSQEPMMDGPQEMAADTKEILDGSVHREKPLRVGSRFESAHLTLPLPGRLVRDFRPIVRVLVRAVDRRRHHGAAGGWVTAQFVGDQSSRDAALSFQQLPEEAEGGPPVAPRLHEDVEDVAVLVHSTPQILPPPLDLQEQLVEIPGVALAAPAVPQPARVVEPELPTPLPNGLVRHGDTPFGEEILDIPETHAETVVEPDSVTDDVRGKAVSAVAGRLARHRATLPPAG